jgi:hypothetical protein
MSVMSKFCVNNLNVDIKKNSARKCQSDVRIKISHLCRYVDAYVCNTTQICK